MLSQRYMDRLVKKTIPLVEEATNWKIKNDFTVTIVPEHESYDFYLECLKAEGIDVAVKSLEGLTKDTLERKITSYAMLALCAPTSNTLAFMGDAIANPEDENGLIQLVGHELTHMAQHQNNEHLTETCWTLGRKAKFFTEFSGAPFTEADKLYRGLMTLLEGQARVVEAQINKSYPGHYGCWEHPEIPLTKQNAFYWAYNEARKLWYTEGERIIGDHYLSSGKEGVKDLYTLAPEALWQVMRTEKAEKVHESCRRLTQ
ncbi:hypothetical protein GOV11_01680 [Candidatus Woesearchaeota archaeon]|nr:hypothetical protein [Candidatus Woesearchaeota archaeon]